MLNSNRQNIRKLSLMLDYRQIAGFIALIVLIFSCFNVFLTPASASGASMQLSPASGSYAVGSTFTVNIYVSSADQAINAVSGVVGYPVANLRAIGLDKSGSKINLWVQEPSYSNANGRVSFEGLVLNPGYQGSGGKVVGVTFKVVKAGTAVANFINGAVLANDGQGTNIVSGLAGGRYTLTGAIQEEDVSVPPAGTPAGAAAAANLPLRPSIISATHPNQGQWYNTSTAILKWWLEKFVNGVSYANDQNPATEPDTIPEIFAAAKSYDSLPDGIYYFHLRVKNNLGWSAAAHYKYLVDKTKPEISAIKSLSGDEATSTFRFSIAAADALSGIDRYEIRVDNGAAKKIISSSSIEYEVSGLSDAKHVLGVQVFDRAGNSSFDFVSFNDGQKTAAAIPAAITTVCQGLSDLDAFTWAGFTGLMAALATLLLIFFIGVILGKKKSARQNAETEKAIAAAMDALKADFSRQVKTLKHAKTNAAALQRKSKAASIWGNFSEFLKKRFKKKFKFPEVKIKIK